MSKVFRTLERVEAERAADVATHVDRSFVVDSSATAPGSAGKDELGLPDNGLASWGDGGGSPRRPVLDSREIDGTRPAPGIEDGQAVLGAVQRLCDEHDRLRAAVSAAERECAKLRDEVIALRGQVDTFRRERSQIAQAVTDRLNGVTADIPSRRRALPSEPGAARPAQSTPPVAEHQSRLSAFSRT